MSEDLETQLSVLDGTLRIVAGVAQMSYDTQPDVIKRDDAWQRAIEGMVGNRHWLKILVWMTPAQFDADNHFKIWIYVLPPASAATIHPDKDRCIATTTAEASLVSEVEKIIRLLRDEGEDRLRQAYGRPLKTPGTLARPVE